MIRLPIASSLLFLLLLLLPQMARADDIDPELLARAHTYMEITHAGNMSDKLFDIMLANVEKQMDAVNPGKDDIVKELIKEMFTSLKAQAPALMEESTKVYARHFSKDEFDQLIAFYQTPVGQKVLTEIPALLNEIMQVEKPIVERSIVQALGVLKQKAPQKGLNLPKGI